MNDTQAKLLVHKLTMKYLYNNKHILSDPALSNIPKIVDMVADINKRFYDAVIHHKVYRQIIPIYFPIHNHYMQ